MKRIICLLLFCLVVFAGGCVVNTDTGEAATDISSALNNKSFTDTFTDSIFDLKYSVCTDAQKTLLDAYLGKINVTDVTYDRKAEAMNVTLSVPKVDSIEEAVNENRGEIGNDLKKLQLQGASEEERKACILRNTANLVMNGKYTEDAITLAIGYNQETKRFASDSKLCKIIFGILEQEFTVSTGEEDMPAEIPLPSAAVASGGNFICKYDGHSILVSEIQIYSGSDAVEQVRSLSSINSKVQVEPGYNGYYLEYKVTNLSRNDLVFKNCFTAIKDGVILENTGFSPVGIHDVESIAPSETKMITCFIISDSNSSINWYSTVSNTYLNLGVE